MDRTVRAVLVLTLCYLAFGAYAFGVFLQQPLVAGQSLTVQAALEPFAYVLAMLVGNLALLRAVLSQPARDRPLLDERPLFAAGAGLLLVVAFGAGLHTAGTLVEETFHSHSASNARADAFAYDVAYWLEEYLSHYMMMIPYVVALFLLVFLEVNREPRPITGGERAVVAGCGVVLGFCFAVGCVESAAVDLLVVPLNVLLLAKFYRFKQRYRLELWQAPFSAYWLIGTVTMVPLVLAFRLEAGWLTQPTDLGFGVAD